MLKVKDVTPKQKKKFSIKKYVMNKYDQIKLTLKKKDNDNICK